MQGGTRPAGTTPWGARGEPLFFSGTGTGVGGKKAPALTVAQLRWLFHVVVPLPTATMEESLAFVAGVPRRTHQAYLAHRKRRETEG
jgi:hypothetical protein